MVLISKVLRVVHFKSLTIFKTKSELQFLEKIFIQKLIVIVAHLILVTDKIKFQDSNLSYIWTSLIQSFKGLSASVTKNANTSISADPNETFWNFFLFKYLRSPGKNYTWNVNETVRWQ